MDQPAWLAAAWAEFGVRERAGRAKEPRVLAYFREAGRKDVSDDAVPWCAAFVGAMLKRAGYDGTGSLMARSYLSWGRALDEPMAGAIAVMKRGANPAHGHVAFVVGTTDRLVFLLGGNQGDAVSVAAFEASRILGYRWPPEASVKTPETKPAVQRNTEHNSSGIFAPALAHVLQMEGGYSNDPHDPGGPTNRGITLAVYAQFKGVTVDAVSRSRLLDELKRIPDAAVQDIYFKRYWTPARCAAMPAPLALFHFDASVNHGVAGAARLLQKAAGVEADGEIGPQTLRAIAEQDTAALVTRYAQERRARYRSLAHFWRFGRGWLSRVEQTLARAKELAASDTDSKQGDDRMEKDVEVGSYGNATGKWWLQSRTVWGALISAAATLIPVLGPMIGIELSGDVIKQAGEQTLGAVQAVVGVAGTLLTIYGRLRASVPLTRRNLNVRL